MTRVLYRYFHSYQPTWNPDYSRYGVVNLEIYAVTRETSACWFIEVNGVERRVLKGDGKRYAHERREWAAYSFRRRMAFERSHHERALKKLDDIQNTLILSWPSGQGDKPGVYNCPLGAERLPRYPYYGPLDVGAEQGPWLGYGK